MPEPLPELTPEELILARLAEWREKRPKAIGENEAVRAVGAISRHVWRGNGIKKLIWRASSGACPLCMKLNGRVVGIDKPFLEHGETLTGDPDKEGVVKKLFNKGKKFGPPVHRNCRCTTIAQL